MEDRTRKEMKVRTANAWGNFWANKNVLKSNLHISAKTKIFNQCVVPSLTYRAQTWATTATIGELFEISNNEENVINLAILYPYDLPRGCVEE